MGCYSLGYCLVSHLKGASSFWGGHVFLFICELVSIHLVKQSTLEELLHVLGTYLEAPRSLSAYSHTIHLCSCYIGERAKEDGWHIRIYLTGSTIMYERLTFEEDIGQRRIFSSFVCREMYVDNFVCLLFVYNWSRFIEETIVEDMIWTSGIQIKWS